MSCGKDKCDAIYLLRQVGRLIEPEPAFVDTHCIVLNRMPTLEELQFLLAFAAEHYDPNPEIFYVDPKSRDTIQVTERVVATYALKNNPR